MADSTNEIFQRKGARSPSHRLDTFYARLSLATLIGLGILFLLGGWLVYSEIAARRAAAEFEKNFALLQSAEWLVADLTDFDAARLATQLAQRDAARPTTSLQRFKARLQEFAALTVTSPSNAAPEQAILDTLTAWATAEGGERRAGELTQKTRDWVRRQEAAGVSAMAAADGGGGVFRAALALPRLLAAFGEMRAATATFILGGDRGFIEIYRRAADEAVGQLSVLALVLRGRPEAATVSELRDALAVWQALAKRALDLKNQGNEPELKALLADPQPAATADRLASAAKALAGRLAVARDQLAADADWRRLIRIGAFTLTGLLAATVMVAAHIFATGANRRYAREVRLATDRTQIVFANAFESIVTFNERGIIQSVNPAGEKLFGESAAELRGKNITRLIPQRLLLHELPPAGATRLSCIANRQGYYPFPVEVALSVTEVGQQKYYVAMIRDREERQRSSQVLGHLAAAVHGVPGGAGEDPLRALVRGLCKALDCDQAFVLEVADQADSAIKGLGTLALGGADEIRSIRKFALADSFFEEVLRRGGITLPTGARKTFPDDAMLRDLQIESMVALVLTDGHRATVGAIGILHRQPIEEAETVEAVLKIAAACASAEIHRRLGNDELALERERFAVAMRASGEGFIACDAAGTVLAANGVAERLLGKAADEVIQMPLGDVFRLLNDRTGTISQTAVQRLVETGSAVGLGNRLTLVAADNSRRTIELTSSPVRDRGNRRVGVVLMFRDATERQQLEEEHQKAEKLESLGLAAGGIAHDFNNLLTAILGNISLSLMDADDDSGIAQRLGTAKRACLRAQDLARQLLTFARGGAPIRKTASVGELIADTVRFALRDSATTCEFDLAPDLWPCEIDSGQIAQVIANLAINADHAMPGGGTIHVRCENYYLTEDDEATANLPLRAGRYVRISVRDAGIGIPAEFIDKIFDPYFTTKPKASGLGLATAYSIIKNHDGHIAVESAPGSGSTFCVYLPASEAAAAPPSAAAADWRQAKAAAPAAPGAKKRVLVIDDEEVICMLVDATLAPCGFDVATADDGKAGVKLYQEALASGQPFDLVITDLTIPGGMGGIEAIRRLREIDPGVLAIVSSGYANDPVMSRYREHGFAACIAKPYEVNDLLALVRGLTGGADAPVAETAGPAQRAADHG